MLVSDFISYLKNSFQLICFVTLAAINCFVASYSSMGAWIFTTGSFWIWRKYIANVSHEDKMFEVTNRSQPASTKELTTSAEFIKHSPSLSFDVREEKLVANLLNVTLSKYWTNVKLAIEDCVVNMLWPAIRKSVHNATSVIDIELHSFVLGMDPPVFDIIKISDTNDKKIIFDVEMKWDCKAAMEFLLHTGMKLESINIKVRVTVNGLCHEIPYFKSLSLCLKEFPIFDWNFTGVVDIANASLIKEQIRKKIEEQLVYYVLPNQLKTPAILFLPLPNSIVKITKESKKCQGEISPHPDGILKVCIKSCRNLPPADFTSSLLNPKRIFDSPKWFIKNILPSQRNSDPMIEVKLGSVRIKSKIIFGSLDPNFDFCCEIPLESPAGCKLLIDVFDFDKITGNDLLGFREEDLTLLFRTTTEADGNAKYHIDEQGSIDLQWKKLIEKGEILIGYSWMPLFAITHDVQLVRSEGVISFAINSLSFGNVTLPHISIKLLSEKKPEEEDVATLDEWQSQFMNESKEFKLDHLNSKLMDPSLLRGGMLNFKEYHTYVQITIEDNLRKSSKWSTSLSLNDVQQYAMEKKIATLELVTSEKSNQVRNIKSPVLIEIKFNLFVLANN